MSLPNAFVTLLTTPSYLPGALVLLHSLLALHPAPRDFKTVCLVTPETVDAKSIGALREAGYDLVIGVEPIGSGVPGQEGLELMGRPDLNLALTKLHLFRLATLFSTLVYLDADTLPLRPLSHLFTSTAPHVLSACPDTGWPDCFNSGVMVIRPRDCDFDKLQQMLKDGAEDGELYKGNGSFDGADQGLLNEYFSPEGEGGDWNRLSFTYNTTPSAAYTYAPAYKRYGHKINVVHFIGPHKPWSNLGGRPAGMGLPQGKEQTYDCEFSAKARLTPDTSLVDRWYAIYDAHVRRTAAHAPDLAQRFSVPEHVAVWNLASGVPVQPDDRLDLLSLRAATERGVTSLKPGQYISLPLEGRVDLIMPKSAAKEAPSPLPSPAASTPPPVIPVPAPHPVHQQQEQPKTWDASRYAPPRDAGPEMAVPMSTQYGNAWEQPAHSQRNYFEAPQSEPRYPTLPSNVVNDAWYKQFANSVPDRSSVQAVFPWEKKPHHAARVFPRGDTPPQTPRTSAPELSVQIPTPPVAVLQPVHHVAHQPVHQISRSFQDAMASYTNAWDDLPGIRRYANRLTRLGIGSQPPVPPPAPTVPTTPTVTHPHRSMALDSRSEGSRDGDDEGASADESEPGSSPTAVRHVARFPDQALPHDQYMNERYRDCHAQTDRHALSDAKVQAIPGGGPSPAVRTIELPDGTPPRHRPSGLGMTGVTVAVGPSVSGPSGSRRSSSDSQKCANVVTPPTHRPPSGYPTERKPFPVGKTPDAFPGHARPAHAGHHSGRSWDPNTDIESRRRDTQEVLSRFMHSGR
ncbi:glycogenin glucosyltransferase [Cryptotrichosporon argae]